MAFEVGHVLKRGECSSGEQWLKLAAYLTECPHQSAILMNKRKGSGIAQTTLLVCAGGALSLKDPPDSLGSKELATSDTGGWGVPPESGVVRAI